MSQLTNEQEVEVATKNSDLAQLVRDVLILEGTITPEGYEEIFDNPKFNWGKIEIDDCRLGDKVRICWKMDGYKFSDIAYITAIPGVGDHEDATMCAIFHCPNPENPGGIGDVGGEFISLLSAAENQLIISIKPLHRRNN